jgi:hypothetical protein
LRDSVTAPSLERVRYIATNVLAFSPTGRGDRGQSTWQCSRDQTQLLSEFEKAALRNSCRLFLTPNHTYATLDDLYGTRATDNQVKSLSARKADREGHCADALADALFRMTFFVRFRRRGHTQNENVTQLFNCVLERLGEHSLHGFSITADRGYAKMSLVKQPVDYDIGFVLIMPEHLIAFHPFFGKSYLRVGRDDEDSESGGDRAQTGTTSEASEEEINSTEAAILSSPTVHLDRSRPFVVNDDPDAGPASFFCSKSFQRNRNNSRTKVTAAAVREHGTVKFSKVLRFMYRVPPSVLGAVETWIAVPASGKSSSTLFIRRNDSGRIITPSADVNDCVTVRGP